MSERIRILGMFAILGFIAGVIANFTYHYVLPVIFTIFPEVLSVEWVLSGLAGAILTICIMLAWAYASKSQ
jgi:chromate transport protein ChrA